MRTGRRPALSAMEASRSTLCINAAPRSAVVVRVLATCTGSTVELPSKPDSGSAGSSSRVSFASRHCGASTGLVALLEISNFARLTACVRAILGPWRAPEERGAGAHKRHFEGSFDGRGLGL